MIGTGSMGPNSLRNTEAPLYIALGIIMYPMKVLSLQSVRQ